MNKSYMIVSREELSIARDAKEFLFYLYRRLRDEYGVKEDIVIVGKEYFDELSKGSKI